MSTIIESTNPLPVTNPTVAPVYGDYSRRQSPDISITDISITGTEHRRDRASIPKGVKRAIAAVALSGMAALGVVKGMELLGDHIPKAPTHLDCAAELTNRGLTAAEASQMCSSVPIPETPSAVAVVRP